MVCHTHGRRANLRHEHEPKRFSSRHLQPLQSTRLTTPATPVRCTHQSATPVRYTHHASHSSPLHSPRQPLQSAKLTTSATPLCRWLATAAPAVPLSPQPPCTREQSTSETRTWAQIYMQTHTFTLVQTHDNRHAHTHVCNDKQWQGMHAPPCVSHTEQAQQLGPPTCGSAPAPATAAPPQPPALPPRLVRSWAALGARPCLRCSRPR